MDGAYANLVLPSVLIEHGLAGRDAAFATELASGTLRMRGTYDAILDACVDRPLRKVEDKVLDALRLGTHQLLSMRVPAHAAISTTVDLVRAKGSSGAAAFSNAVLRRVGEQDLEAWLLRVAPPASTTSSRHAEIAYSHPRWIVDELRRALGLRGAARAAGRRQRGAAGDPGRPARPGPRARSCPASRRPTRPTARSWPGEPPARSRRSPQGRAGVQDEGSQLVAHVLAAAALTGPDDTWVDLCAGPGGKAALLAGLAAERGAGLVAVERQPHRARLVQRSLAPSVAAGARVAVLTADGTRPPLRPGTVDRVLVDAPCTGLGALRRRPEARWRRKPEDSWTSSCSSVACSARPWTCVRPGGVVLYATCSPVHRRDRRGRRLGPRSAADVVVEDAAALLPQVPDARGRTEGTVQLWPHRHGTDAMFMALLRKV